MPIGLNGSTMIWWNTKTIWPRRTCYSSKTMQGFICALLLWIALRILPTSTIYSGYIPQWLFSIPKGKEMSRTIVYFEELANILIWGQKKRVGPSSEIIFSWFIQKATDLLIHLRTKRKLNHPESTTFLSTAVQEFEPRFVIHICDLIWIYNYDPNNEQEPGLSVFKYEDANKDCS